MKELEAKVMNTSEHRKGEKNKEMRKSELESINYFCYHPHLKVKVKTKEVAEPDSADSESAITTVESEQGDMEEVRMDKKIH